MKGNEKRKGKGNGKRKRKQKQKSPSAIFGKLRGFVIRSRSQLLQILSKEHTHPYMHTHICAAIPQPKGPPGGPPHHLSSPLRKFSQSTNHCPNLLYPQPISIFYPLGHSPDQWLELSRSKAESQELYLGVHMGTGVQGLGPSTTELPGHKQIEAGQKWRVRTRTNNISDASTTGGSLVYLPQHQSEACEIFTLGF